MKALLLICLSIQMAVPQNFIVVRRMKSPPAGGSGYSFVTGTAASANGSSPTTSGVNTTGVDLMIVAIGWFNSGQSTTAPTITDSKSNTWTALTVRNTGVNLGTVLYYSRVTSVGSGHTFTLSGQTYSSICVAGFSGSISSPFDQENGYGTSPVTTIQPGSVTPSNDNQLVVSGLASGGVGYSYSINSSFTIAVQDSGSPSSSFPCGLAYKIQTSAAAVNPTWTLSNSTQAAAAIGTFKSQ